MQSLGQWFGRQVNMQNLQDLAGEIDPITGYPMNWNHSYHDNPYWLLHNNTNSRNRDRVIGNLNLNYQFTDWLAFKAVVGTDWYIEDRNEKTAHLTNGDRKGGYWAGSYRRNQLNANGAFTFNKTIGSDISVIASLGGEFNKYDYQYHETYDDREGVENDAPPGGIDSGEDRFPWQPVLLPLLPVPPQEMDGIIHSHTDHDRG